MSQSIAEQAIAAAQAAAANQTGTATPSTTSLPAVQSTGTAVGEAVTPGTALSMETIGGGQMTVDEWLKVNEHGLKVGDKAGLVQSMKVIIDMRDGVGFTVKMGIKGGNPAQYAYTLDNKIAGSGKPWDMECARIRLLAPSAAPYRCVDLPMVTSEAIKNAKDELLIEEGKVLGYTTSTTNWGNWELLYREVAKAGLMGQKVLVELTAQERTNKNKNVWGVVLFKLLGLAPDDSAGE